MSAPLSPDDPLRSYIEKVLDLLHRDAAAAPSPEVLAAVARDLGLSEADKARLEAAAADALARGQGYLEHGRFDDAIPELETALALRIGDLEAMHALASAHVGRAIATDSEESDAAARALVKQTLARHPRHKASYELLNRLDAGRGKGPAPQAGAKSPRQAGKGKGKGKGGTWWKVGLASGAALLVAGVYVALGGPDVSSGSLVSSPSPGAGTPRKTPSGATLAKLKNPISVTGEGRIDAPLEADSELTDKGISVEVKASWVTVYSSSAYYNAWVLLKNESKEDFVELKVESTILDAEGDVLKSQLGFPVSSLSQAMRPGDTRPLRLISEVSRAVAGARLRLVSAESKASVATGPSTPVEFTWAVPKPEGVEVEIRERWAEVTANSMKDGGFWHKAILEVHNKSAVPLSALVLTVQRFDGDGTMRNSDTENVAMKSDIPLFPGEVRIIAALENTEVPTKQYKLSVTQVQSGLSE